MSTNAIAKKLEHSIKRYFEACATRDAKAIAVCFAADAVHYLPHLSPLHGGTSIGNAIAGDLHNRGGQYFIDRILTDVDKWAAGVEWSRTFQHSDQILRGFESCEFEPASCLIREIRGYYAAPPHRALARHELLGFNYADRDYKTI